MRQGVSLLHTQCGCNLISLSTRQSPILDWHIVYHTCVPQPRETIETCWGFSVALLKQFSPRIVVLKTFSLLTQGNLLLKHTATRTQLPEGLNLTVMATHLWDSELKTISQIAPLSSFSRCSFNLVLRSFLKEKPHFNRRKTNINPSLCLTPLPHQWQQSRAATGHHGVVFFMEKFHCANCRYTALNQYLLLFFYKTLPDILSQFQLG